MFIGNLNILFNSILFKFSIFFIIKILSFSKFLILLKKIWFFILNQLKIIKKIKEIVKIKKSKLKFKENLNISFEDRDVIYINKISIPPIKIKNNE